MSPELGIALVIALFWGPTALWLAYRTLRGQEVQRQLDSSIEIYDSARSAQRATDEIRAEVESDGSWVCATCRSLNLRAAKRCYSCRAPKDVPDRSIPDEVPVTRGIPVMAAQAPGWRSAGDMPVHGGLQVPAASQTRSSDGHSVDRGVPVFARDFGPAHAEPVHAGPAQGSVAVAAPSDPRSIFELPAPATQPRVSASRPEAPASAPVCPFIGWRDDPSTRYDFPDPANVCHATAGRAIALPTPRRQTTADGSGRGRSKPIDPAYQGSRCLTASHVTCARYPKAKVVEGRR